MCSWCRTVQFNLVVLKYYLQFANVAVKNKARVIDVGFAQFLLQMLVVVGW